MIDAPCPCPWKDSPTPCIDHSHHRANRSGPWFCFMHDHDNTRVQTEPTPEATPRPWVAQSRDDGKSDPWWIDTHAYPDGPVPVWAPPQYPVSEADAALIVEAVNNHDRLLRIEAAARAVMAVDPEADVVPDDEWDPEFIALREALEEHP